MVRKQGLYLVGANCFALAQFFCMALSGPCLAMHTLFPILSPAFQYRRVFSEFVLTLVILIDKIPCTRTVRLGQIILRVSLAVLAGGERPAGPVYPRSSPKTFNKTYCVRYFVTKYSMQFFLRCEGQQSCDFQVRKDGSFKNGHFSDVCNKKNKEITVNYKCGTTVQKCEGGNVE